MTRPSEDPLIQKLQVLVAGTGYDFYDSRNTLRADDLLVRQRSSGALAAGARTLAGVEVEYRRQYIPSATHDSPFPPPAEMEALRSLGRLRARLDDLASTILGMPVPTQDKTWWRFREEKPLLARLLGLDYQMLTQTEELSEHVRSLTAEQWHEHPTAAEIDPLIAEVDSLVRDRGQLLQIT